MTILASCDLGPGNLVVTIFEEQESSLILLDSIYQKTPWTQEKIEETLSRYTKEYEVERWISPEERKMIERSKLLRK